MKDSELRGTLLQILYDLRKSQPLTRFDPLISNDLPEPELRRALTQLEEKGLIDWKFKPYGQLGVGSITAYGTEVVEGDVQPPITMNFGAVIDASVSHSTDKSINISGSSGVHIGDTNTYTLDIEKLNLAIDHSTVSQTEKAEAKSLLSKLFANKIVRGVLEGWAKSFTGGS